MINHPILWMPDCLRHIHFVLIFSFPSDTELLQFTQTDLPRVQIPWSTVHKDCEGMAIYHLFWVQIWMDSYEAYPHYCKSVCIHLLWSEIKLVTLLWVSYSLVNWLWFQIRNHQVDPMTMSSCCPLFGWPSPILRVLWASREGWWWFCNNPSMRPYLGLSKNKVPP